ncbi:ERMES complex subunit [Balamuthia mandrillaris]
MSFEINWPVWEADTIDKVKESLHKAMNSGGGLPDSICDAIHVADLHFGTKPPSLTVLEIAEVSEQTFKAAFRLSYSGEASITLVTKVQVNHLAPSPSSALSQRAMKRLGVLSSHRSLPVPLRLTISHLDLCGTVVVSVRQEAKTESNAQQNAPPPPPPTATTIQTTSTSPASSSSTPLQRRQNLSSPSPSPSPPLSSSQQLNGIRKEETEDNEGEEEEEEQEERVKEELRTRIEASFLGDPLRSVRVTSSFDEFSSVKEYLQSKVEGFLRQFFMEDFPVLIEKLNSRFDPELKKKNES